VKTTPTIYCNQGEQANHYTIDVVLSLNHDITEILLKVALDIITLPYPYFLNFEPYQILSPKLGTNMAANTLFKLVL
jgi:hypothetical protein